MKLSKKILSIVICLGIFFPTTFSMQHSSFGEINAERGEEIFNIIASYSPQNLDECCLALDEALRDHKGIKEKIKNRSDDIKTSYLLDISNTHGTVGYKIAYYWLYSFESDKGRETPEKRRPSALAELFFTHNVDFYGENVMVSIIFENYRYYLNNGKSLDFSIEDMTIEHWYNIRRCIEPNYKREKLVECIRNWPEVKTAYYRALNSWRCTIL